MGGVRFLRREEKGTNKVFNKRETDSNKYSNMKNIENEINNILAHWNPINVPDEIVFDEYKSYIPMIVSYGNNRKLLFDCLLDIVIKMIGLDFDITNETHFKDLNEVCDEIFFVIHKVNL